MHRTFLILLAVLLSASVVPAQPVVIATDYEWELNQPGRSLFRDRTPVGRIPLVNAEGRGGLLSRKGKPSGQSLLLVSDVSFVPGDTLRYFGVGIELHKGEQYLCGVLLDAAELPRLLSSVQYMLQTAGNIGKTDRLDTRIQFRGKSHWDLIFHQKGRDQSVILSFPAEGNLPLQSVELTPPQLSTLIDLIGLTVFDLKRQGANLTIESK